MTVKKLALGQLQANCYLLSTDSAAVCIDIGAFDKRVLDFFEENSDKQRLILLTHAHFDHIGGADKLRELTGVEIAIGEKDAPALTDKAKTLSRLFGINVEPFDADITVCDGQEFTVGDITFKAIETAGHTLGGMCYLTDNMLFCGDTLFEGSIGRTDCYGGDGQALLKSLKKLALLPDDTRVFSGHGGDTTIGNERRYNPYMKYAQTL